MPLACMRVIFKGYINILKVYAELYKTQSHARIAKRLFKCYRGHES